MAKTQKQQSTEAASHKYRIEVPNSIDDMNLSPHAFRLYARIKRRAADNGVCRDGDRDLAAHCKMSQPTVSRAKSQLKKAGLIETRRVKGVDEIRIVDIWQENYDRFAPREASEDRFSQNQSDSIGITPPDPLNRIEGTVQEPSERTTQELSLSPRASHAQGTGDEPEREREVEPRFKTKYTLEQVQSCARAKGMGDGWVNDALWKGIHDWQIEQHLNPPLPMPPVAAPLLDPKQCDDCNGTGFWSPGGAGKGVAKCPHKGLLAKLKARADEESGAARGSPEAAVG